MGELPLLWSEIWIGEIERDVELREREAPMWGTRVGFEIEDGRSSRHYCFPIFEF